MPIKKRLLYYFLLALFSIIIPFVLTMALVNMTGSREAGMGYAVLPSLFAVQFIFGIIFIDKAVAMKWLYCIVLPFLVLAIVALVWVTYYILLRFEMFGFFGLAITNFLTGVIIWETFYQLDKRQKIERMDKSTHV